MLTDDETAFLGDSVLALFNGGIVELLDFAALQADQMIVVLPFVELKDGFAGFEIVTFKQAGLFELGKDPINRGQADVHVFGDEQPVDVFGGQVTGFDLLEEIQNLESWEGCLQADTFEVLGIA